MFAALARFIQMLLDALVAVLNGISTVFPPSPFDFVVNSSFGGLIRDINFFLPIYEFLAVAQAWLVAVAVYYGISVVARWVKAIE